MRALVAGHKSTGGRNNVGRLTTRHKGSGHKHNYRMIDFRRDKDGIVAKVERLEYDPNRSSYIALLLYKDGERRYILAPKGVAVGDELQSGADSPIRAGNAMQLRHIPVGSIDAQHRAEARQGRPDRARRRHAPRSYSGREAGNAILRLKSGETRKVSVDCRATIGEIGNDEHNLRSYGKAGAKRWRGIRPTVRGVVMNPVDHPHGGGEGRSGQGNPHPVSPWGWHTKGKKTRKNKRTDAFIVRRRKKGA